VANPFLPDWVTTRREQSGIALDPCKPTMEAIVARLDFVFIGTLETGYSL
jgi:hypothetical protein